MKVYLREVGEDHLRCVAGVYSTWQLARQAQLRDDPLANPDDIVEMAVDEDSPERRNTRTSGAR